MAQTTRNSFPSKESFLLKRLPHKGMVSTKQTNSTKRNGFHQKECLKSITRCNCLSPSVSSMPRIFQSIGESGAKKYFTDHRTANTVQLFVAIKGNLSGLFFSWTMHTDGEIPRGYLINVATLHIIVIDIKQWTKTCLNCQSPGIRTNSPCKQCSTLGKFLFSAG